MAKIAGCGKEPASSHKAKAQMWRWAIVEMWKLRLLVFYYLQCIRAFQYIINESTDINWLWMNVVFWWFFMPTKRLGFEFCSPNGFYPSGPNRPPQLLRIGPATCDAKCQRESILHPLVLDIGWVDDYEETWLRVGLRKLISFHQMYHTYII